MGREIGLYWYALPKVLNMWGEKRAEPRSAGPDGTSLPEVGRRPRENRLTENEDVSMTTYYVSTNGSDSGKGTSGSPWKTINKAMKANLKSGDEVVVRSGTYKEGRPQSPRTASRCARRCPGAPRSTPLATRSASTSARNYVTVRGFEVYGSTKGGIVGNGIHHVKVLDNIAHDNASNGILLMKSDFITVDGNVTYDNASVGAPSGISIFHPVNITGIQVVRRVPNNRPKQRLLQQPEQIRCTYRRQRNHFR